MLASFWLAVGRTIIGGYFTTIRWFGTLMFRIFVFCYCSRMEFLRKPRRTHHQQPPTLRPPNSALSSSFSPSALSQPPAPPLLNQSSVGSPSTASSSFSFSTALSNNNNSALCDNGGELSKQNKHLLAALVLMGYQLPSLMISYRPSIQSLYGRRNWHLQQQQQQQPTHQQQKQAAAFLPRSSLVHSRAIMHYTASVTSSSSSLSSSFSVPTIVWLCMPWEFNAASVTKFLQRLGAATGCNVLALQITLDGDVSSPLYLDQFCSSLLQLIHHQSQQQLKGAPLLLGAADLAGMFALQLLAFRRDAFAGCFLLDPFVGWTDVSYHGGKKHLIHVIESVVGRQLIRSWFPQYHLLKGQTPTSYTTRTTTAADPVHPDQLVATTTCVDSSGLPPTVMLMNVDGLWFNEQLQFDHRFSPSDLSGGGTPSSSLGDSGTQQPPLPCTPPTAPDRWDLQCLPFRITPSATAPLSRSFWDTTEVDGLLHQVEGWITELFLLLQKTQEDGTPSARTARLERNASYGSSMTRLDTVDDDGDGGRFDSLDSMEGIFTPYMTGGRQGHHGSSAHIGRGGGAPPRVVPQPRPFHAVPGADKQK